MPNRMLRDWTRSDVIDQISVEAERFFTRLIMKADDYGCYYADPRLLKSDLFPLKEAVKEAQVLKWRDECRKAQIIVVYKNTGKEYLQIINFKQRLDRHKQKFPFPTEEDLKSLTIAPDAEEPGGPPPPTPAQKKVLTPPTLQEVEEYFKENGYTVLSAGKAYKYYDTADWHDSKGSKVKNWKQKMQSVWFKPENLAPVQHKKYIPTEGDKW
jgi:hypothetical protein